MKRQPDAADMHRRTFLRGVLFSGAAVPAAAAQARVEAVAPKPVYDDIREHLDHII